MGRNRSDKKTLVLLVVEVVFLTSILFEIMSLAKEPIRLCDSLFLQ